MDKRLWISVFAAVVLEALACVQYFYNYHVIKHEACERAECELRAAELEIDLVMSEQEHALQMAVSLIERYIDQPDSLAPMANLMLQTMPNTSNVGIAFVSDYFPKKGHWFEIYTYRDSIGGEQVVVTREIGGPNHDYFQDEWFNNAFTHDSCWWSEPYYDNSGAQSMVVTCSHPLHDKKGDVVGVAGIDVSLDYLASMKNLQLYPDSYYFITSSKGMDIVTLPEKTSKRKYLLFEEGVETTGWRIAIVIPEDVLFAELRKTGLIVLILMFIGLALVMFILYHSARNVQSLIAVTAQKERMLGELEIAQTIQITMLPTVFPPFPDHPDLNIYGFVRPAKEIGGDLYDFYFRQNKLFFCVGDVSGKGIPASLLMTMTRSLFRSITAHEERAAHIMMLMNDALAEDNEMDMFITFFIGVLDTTTGVLEYCNAGHNTPARSVDGLWQKITVFPNIPIGIERGYTYRAQSVTLQYNEVLFLYTDGLTEAENNRHEQFREERMLSALADMKCSSPRKIVDTMHENVDAFVAGAPQSDDLTMLAIRYQHPAIVLGSDIQQLAKLAEWVDALDIPAELNRSVNLALEETVSNVMLYAYPDKNGSVWVEFVKMPDAIIFTVSDTGVPFDPTQKPEADITLSVEERPIGGLGIYLMRQLMDEVYYERIDNKNILTLIKHV